MAVRLQSVARRCRREVDLVYIRTIARFLFQLERRLEEVDVQV